jgi:hypothetical protein
MDEPARPHLHRRAGRQGADWQLEFRDGESQYSGPHGWKQSTVRIGDQITVSGYLARKGERMAIADAVADATGKPIFESNPADIGR